MFKTEKYRAMKNFNKYISGTFIAVLFTVIGCDFGDLNVNPTKLSEGNIKPSHVLPAATSLTLFNQGALAGRMPGIITQHFLGIDAQQLPYSSYVINESDLNNLWASGMYGGSMKDLIVIIEKAQDEENPQPHYEGIAKVLLAQNINLITTFWGDAPFAEAFQGSDLFKPVFDTQESIYASTQAMLDDAISLLGQPAVAGGPGDDDLIYGGDASLWLKTAYALKARVYMQTTKKDTDAHNKALPAISKAYTSNDEESIFYFGAPKTESNPYAQFGEQRPGTLVVHTGFHDRLANNNDPRIEKLMVEDGGLWQFYDGPASSLFWSSNDSPLPIISNTEVRFLEAEAQLRAGSDAAAISALQAGIIANMEQLGVASADYDAYVTARADFAGLTTFEEKLERIIEEKYVALYGQAEPEVWSDFRRTGFPALTPHPDGTNGLNPSGEIPRRFIYPRDERSTNDENMQAAIDRLGGDTLSQELWVFK